MDATRRQFLIGAGAAVGTALAGTVPLKAATEGSGTTSPTSSHKLKGHLYSLGSQGELYPGNYAAKSQTSSVITSVNLEDGSIRSTLIPIGTGHTAMGALDGRILCIGQYNGKSVMLDADHKIIETFQSAPGYEYGGHGIVFKDRNIFIMSLRKVKAETLDDVGIIEVYDLHTLKKLDSVPTGGVHPHELRKIPGKDEIAMTHYGDLSTKMPPLEFNVKDPKLSILDSATFKPKRHYSQADIKACATHMRVDEDGWAYFVFTQFVDYGNLAGHGMTALDVGVQAVQEQTGYKYDIPIPNVATTESRLASPIPMVRVNTQTGERQIIKAGDEYHLASQSVAYSKKTRTAIASFYHSDVLVLSTPGKNPEIITADQLQLTEIHGVAEIVGTPYIAVGAYYAGMSIMDLATRKVIAHYPTHNYAAQHVYYEYDV